MLVQDLLNPSQLVLRLSKISIQVGMGAEQDNMTIIMSCGCHWRQKALCAGMPWREVVIVGKRYYRKIYSELS